LARQDDRETSKERRAAALVEKFGADYQTYQYAFVDFLVDHLTDLSRAYGGDFQQIMVLAIIGQKWLHAIHDNVAASELGSGALAISASRLADVTGIPRETVRRKLALMQAKGWIRQGPDGAWSLAVDESTKDLPAYRDHSEIDMRARWRVARLVVALESVGRYPKE
jgi:hypothetical protein